MKLFRRVGGPGVSATLAEPMLDQSEAGAELRQAPLDAAFLLDEEVFSRRLTQIDAVLESTPIRLRPALFDQLPADLFALLCLHRPERYPNLARWLPRMPAADLQLNSTGACGQRTLLEAARFVAAVVQAYTAGGRSLAEAKVLDFGVCWARIARLLYQHVPTDQLYGTDAWPLNLQAARDCGFAGQLAEIDETPSRLPFPDVQFDLVLAFSVFTHLSRASGEATARAIRAAMSRDALLAVTLRPAAYADILAPERRAAIRDGLAANGFGYFPEPWSRDGVYGDAVASLDHVRDTWTGFEIVGVEASAADPYQTYVLLRAS